MSTATNGIPTMKELRDAHTSIMVPTYWSSSNECPSVDQLESTSRYYAPGYNANQLVKYSDIKVGYVFGLYRSGYESFIVKGLSGTSIEWNVTVNQSMVADTIVRTDKTTTLEIVTLGSHSSSEKLYFGSYSMTYVDNYKWKYTSSRWVQTITMTAHTEIVEIEIKFG